MSRKKTRPHAHDGGKRPERRPSGVGRAELLQLLQEQQGGVSAGEIAKMLHLRTARSHRELDEQLHAMLEAGEIKRHGKRLRAVRLRGGHGPSWQGTVSAHPDGFGFVAVPGRAEDIFLPPEQMRGVMHGDMVEVRVIRRRGREAGELIRVVKQAQTTITAQLRIDGGIALAEPRSRRFPFAVLVAKKDANGAHDGDWVRIEIERDSDPLRGRVVSVLGDSLKPADLIEVIVAEQELPDEFPDAVLKETAVIPDQVAHADKAGRTDLTHLPFVTIDGEDARDFDDAICVQSRGEGFEAWVAIADVAHYVKPGSALDEEALSRSNSFYFPDRVIPMLPEKLSNGLCSLNPDVPRLAMAVRMRFDAAGIRRSIRIHEALIHSQARLTYTQVAAWLEDHDEQAVAKPAIRAMLNDANQLFAKLEQGREQRGALDLDLPEVRAMLDEDGISGMQSRDRNTAHKLIEEMMLAANTAVAEYFESKGSPLLYRVHPAPEATAIDKLNAFLEPFGIAIRHREGQAPKPGDVQRVLEQSEGRPFAHVLHRLILRSMQQARYTTNNDGHFGLAYRSYCHFTSPIRRYADLTVHRRLKALVNGANPDDVQPADTLAAIGEQTSTQERKQQRAEWDTQAMLAALYHKKDVGQTMPAIIAGLTKRRIFFELQPSLAEGSLNVDLLSGSFSHDEVHHRLVSRRGGITFALGDKVEVTIESTDPVRGMINVTLVGETVEHPAPIAEHKPLRTSRPKRDGDRPRRGKHARDGKGGGKPPRRRKR